MSPGALSRWILWNKPTLKASIADFKKRFTMRGGKKYETFDQFNEEIKDYIKNEYERFIEQYDAGVPVNDLIQRIREVRAFLDEAEKENPEFYLIEEVEGTFDSLTNHMGDMVDYLKPGAKKALKLEKITKQHYEFQDPKEREAHLRENINNLSEGIGSMFGFDDFKEYSGTSGKDEYTFWTSVSKKPSMKRVEVLVYVITSRDGVPVHEVPHRVTLICMPKGLVYYNSTGEKIKDLPKDLQIYIRKRCGPILDENPFIHQWASPVCERHSLLRSCNAELSNDEYNDLLYKEAAKRNFSYDELVWILTEEATWGDSLKLTGGICKKCGKHRRY